MQTGISKIEEKLGISFLAIDELKTGIEEVAPEKVSQFDSKFDVIMSLKQGI